MSILLANGNVLSGLQHLLAMITARTMFILTLIQIKHTPLKLELKKNLAFIILPKTNCIVHQLAN